MIQLVTKTEVKEQIRIDGTADDDWIDAVLPAITQSVVNWCGGKDRVQDGDGNALEPARLATLVEIAYQYRYREDAEDTKEIDYYRQGYVLTSTATALLTPLRKPLAR